MNVVIDGAKTKNARGNRATELLEHISALFTKEEVIAILTELQLEIEKTVKEEELIDKKWANGLHYSEKIIQQKINKLKGENNGQES